MRWARVMVMVGAAALAAVGCGGDGGDDDEEDAAPEPPPTATSSTALPPVTPPQVPPDECRAASEADVVDIDLSMTSFDTRVAEAHTATVGDYRYVAGNLRQSDGTPVGPAVWAFDGQVLYAVSDLAAEYSAFFPSRDPLHAVDDAVVTALLGCVPPA